MNASHFASHWVWGAVILVAGFAASAQAVTGVELLTNGSFETGNLSGWTKSPAGPPALIDTLYSAQVLGSDNIGGNPIAPTDGQWMAKFDTTSLIAGLGDFTMSLGQTVNAWGSTGGLLSFDFRMAGLDINEIGLFSLPTLSEAGPDGMRVLVNGNVVHAADLNDPSGRTRLIPFLNSGHTAPTVTPWVHVEVPLTQVDLTSNLSALFFSINDPSSLYNTGSNGQAFSLYLDNASLRVWAIPEPTTTVAGLLSLAAVGLAALRQRRI